jgi:hypothetical protein
METLHTIWMWFITTASLVAVVLAIFGANYLRNKILDIRQNWESAVMPSIAFLLLHLGIYWINPVFWVNWFNSNGFILMQMLIVAGFYTASLKTKPAGVIGRGLVLVGFVGISLGVWTTLKTTYPTFWVTTSTQTHTPQTRSTTTSSVVFPEIPQDNPDAVKADKFWRENLGSQVDQAQMLWTTKEESDFKQFGKDGKVLRSKTDDIGIMQINEPEFLEKSKELGYDIYTTEGNLRMALWIYQNHGPMRWVTYEEARKLAGGFSEHVVIAPVGSWSERVQIVAGTMLKPRGPVLIRDDRGNFHEDDDVKGMKPLIVTRYVEFQSRGEEPVKVTVSR